MSPLAMSTDYLNISVDLISSQKLSLASRFPSYGPPPNDSFFQKCLDQHSAAAGHPKKLPSSRPLKLSSRLNDLDQLVSSQRCVLPSPTFKLITSSPPSLDLTISTASFSPTSSHIVLGYVDKSYVNVLSSQSSSQTIQLKSSASSAFIHDPWLLITTPSEVIIFKKTEEKWEEELSLALNTVLFAFFVDEFKKLVVCSESYITTFDLVDPDIPKLAQYSIKSQEISCDPLVIGEFLYFASIVGSVNYLNVYHVITGKIITSELLPSKCVSLKSNFDKFLIMSVLVDGSIVFFDLVLHNIPVKIDGQLNTTTSLSFPTLDLAVDSVALNSFMGMASVVFKNYCPIILNITNLEEFSQMYCIHLLEHNEFEKIRKLFKIVDGKLSEKVLFDLAIRLYSVTNISNFSKAFDFLNDLLTFPLSNDLLNLLLSVKQQLEVFKLITGV
ncbi:hypothetical protein GEMRC1_013551 [Eukaryota sp. GEM-RC1]